MKFILLDLGNVVIGVDFRRVFTSWAKSAQVSEQRFYDRWALDPAYEQHEVGAITFAEYTDHLGKKFEIELSIEDWQKGWNDLWTSPFHGVIELLPALSAQHRLFAFTNTNDTHANCWRGLFGQELSPFEEIYVSSEIGVRKPSPDAYLDVCERMGTTPQNVMFIDDTMENIDGALEAGIDAHHVKTETDVVNLLSPLLSS
ncbi:MAG: HAD-IA family hydrolase [Pseudomonadales bacterium]|nr:HAD-IA family hydrolase [Pseudomonadales bacterium]